MKTSLVTLFSATLFATAAALLFSSSTFASPAVLIEDPPTKEIVPLSQRISIRETEEQNFDDAFALRAKRRVGVGLGVMGQLGMMGALLELNFTPDNALNLGFGGGPGYSAFNLGWKYVITGRTLTPYFSGGYSAWHGLGGDISNSTPSVLSAKFLSEDEKRSGKFEIGFLTPTAGLQYTQLSGEYVGWSGFLELTMMTKLSDGLATAPLISLGGIRYF